MSKYLTWYEQYKKDSVALIQQQLALLNHGTLQPTQDKRFQHQAWQETKVLHFLTEHYLLAVEHYNKLPKDVIHKDPKLQKKWQFLIKHILESLSPDNFFATNPEVMQVTLKSQGQNLIQGFQNLLKDIDTDTLRFKISMTDKSAFQIGANIATTKGEVIYRNHLFELIQYYPQTKTCYAVPLLIIPPWINKYYILDLSPHNSLVRYLVNAGINVFMISWVNPDERYANAGLEHYLLDGAAAAIKIIQQQLTIEKINTLGFCIGGTLLSMLLAYQPQPINSATLLATLIDFKDPGDIGVFIDEAFIAQLEQEMARLGYLDGNILASAFNALRGKDLIWSFFVRNYLKGETPPPLDLLYWNADSTNLPMRMHKEYLRWMYLKNLLAKPNGLIINNQPLNIKNITTPSFFVATKQDHIAPWQSVYQGFKKFQGEKNFILGGSGHIAGIINSPAQTKYGYQTHANAERTAKLWEQYSHSHQGSWWPEWLNWLISYSGKQFKAKEPSNALCPAPGEYVHKKI